MKLNLNRLKSIETTLKAIEDIDKSLKWYKENSSGPVYMAVTPPGGGRNDTVHFQIDREQFRRLMNERKQELIRRLEDRFEGFEYDSDAP